MPDTEKAPYVWMLFVVTVIVITSIITFLKFLILQDNVLNLKKRRLFKKMTILSWVKKLKNKLKKNQSSLEQTVLPLFITVRWRGGMVMVGEAEHVQAAGIQELSVLFN